MSLALDTATPAQLKRCNDRWYDLIPLPIQVKLVKAVRNGILYPVIPAGRRSGKTERFKRFLAKTAMSTPGCMYFAAAPTREQAKKIFWKDLKEMTFSPSHPKRPSETALIIYLPNMTEIHVIGLDRPERIEGTPWDGGGIDEIANIHPDAWAENIYPALNTQHPMRPDYRPWCWLLGVPDGLNHYYDMAQYAQNSGDPLWGLFHWKSSDILTPDRIEAAKRSMSARQYRQEYEASFETASGRIYEDYGKQNTTHEEIESHEQLLWMHDFNYTPLSSSVGVLRDGGKGSMSGDLYFLDEVVLTSAISRQSAQEFADKFVKHGNKHVIVYGDPAGQAGAKHGQSSDYSEMKSVLLKEGWKVSERVTPAAPAIKDRQNSVRRRICTAAGKRTLFVNPNKCPYTHKGLSTVQFKEGSTFLEADSDYQHITTAIGYGIHYEWPVRDKRTKMR
jgi:hypothetical protein